MTQLASSVWGGKSVEITQGFGVYNSDHPDWYAYAEDYGQPYGTHIGLDIGVQRGTPIFALNDGIVSWAGFNNSFRPFPVYVETEDDPDTRDDESGYVEIYGHLAANSVTTNQRIKAGKQLGVSGEQTVQGTTNVPDGSGPHLHFELRQPGANTPSGYKAIDPTNWLQKKGIVTKPDDTNEKPTETDPGSVTDLIPTVLDLGKRSLFVLIGGGILLIGLYATFSGGFSGTTGRIPAVKVARKVLTNAD